MLTEHEIEFMELLSHLTTLANIFCEYAKDMPNLDTDLLNQFVILNDYVQRINEVLTCFID